MIRGAAPLLSLALAAGGASTGWAAAVEYLDVGASEGGSLGGHAALRVGDVVYHYQHRAPGLLVLDRDDAGAFHWRYGVLQNRSMRAVEVVMPDAAVRALGARLDEALLVQRQHLGVRDALARERRLLAAWTREDPAPDTTEVRGAAAFFRDGDALGETTALAPDLARAIGRLRAEITALDPGGTPALPARLRPGIPVNAGRSIADRHRDLAERLVALDVLARGRRVLAERVVRLDGEPPLTPIERGALESLRARLSASIVRLPRSARPDWGLALLVSIARLEAVRASLAAGRLVVVAAPGRPGEAIRTDRPAGRAYAADVARGARVALRAVRSRTIGAGRAAEADWAALEHAALRAVESAGWSRPGLVVRTAPADATPTEAVRLGGVPRPAAARTSAAAALARTERALREYDAVLDAAYGYDLRDRNCATELVRALGDAGLPGVSAATLRGAGFVPRVSFDRVAAAAEAGRVRALPSLRRRRLAAMRRREADLLVRLREDNVLTSTLRLATDGEPAFAFFTDDTLLSRPLYGAANLAVAATQAGVGLLAAPFDRARTLGRGLRGVVASVPELAFASVRTGRLRYDMDAGTEGPR